MKHRPTARLAFLALVVLCGGAPAAAQDIRRAEFEAEIEAWHLVDLDGDGRREALVFFADDEKGKPYRVVRRPERGELVLTPRAHLPADTVALALRRSGSGAACELVLLAPAAVASARWTGETFEVGPRLPVTHTPLFRAARQGPPPMWHWEIDYDGDGFGDLMLPVDAGVELRRGLEKGGLGPATLVRLPGRRAVSRGAPESISITRTLPHPVFRDADADGRLDLTWFDGEGLGFARQNEDGSFAPAERFELPWLSEAAGDLVEKTDVSLQDADGDGHADLLLSRMRTDPERVTDMKTTVVLLRNRGGEAPFGRAPDHAVVIPGVAGVGPTLLDCNGDGRQDLVVGSYGAKLSDAVSRFLGGIPMEFQVFLGEGRGFAARPGMSTKVSIGSDAFSELGARHCARIFPDLDGDGRVDLVVMLPRGRSQLILLRPGLGEGGLGFADKPTARVQTRDYRAMSDVDDAGSGPRELLLVGRQRLEFVAFAPTK